MDASNEFTCNEKNALRKELIKRRAAIENRLERENAVVERLLSMTVSSCMIYVSIGSELCTHKAIETFLGSGVELYAPYTSGGEITPKKLVKLGEADARGNARLRSARRICAAAARCASRLLHYRIGCDIL